MKTATASKRAGGRLREVDGLRALAILAVMTSHAFTPLPLPAVRVVTMFGGAGVDLFFVISGFLIGGILMDHREATNYYRVFYARRFWRIVPLYLLILAPTLAVTAFGWQRFFKGHSLSGQTGATIWLQLLFLQNIVSAFGWGTAPLYLGPTWSLAVEEQFYLLMPPLIRNLRGRLLPWIFGGAILVSPALRGALWWFFGNKASMACYVLLPCRWDALLMGVLCAYAVRTEAWRRLLTARIASLRLGWMVLAAGLLGMMAAKLDYRIGPVMQVAGYTWIAALFACTLLLATMHPEGALCRFLSAPVLKPVATVSYGLYLLHPPITAVVQEICWGHASAAEGWEETGVNLLAMGATGVVAAVSWRFFESRLIQFGHRRGYEAPTESQTSRAEP